MNNKKAFLAYLKSEANKISKEAKPLEAIVYRLDALSERFTKNQSSLAIFQGLSQAMAGGQVSLTSFDYERGKQITLHGQTQELNNVLGFVSELEKLPVLKKMDIKIRYATQKMFQAAAIVDFEIICLKKERNAKNTF